MTLTPEDFKEFDVPYAQVWQRKHDYMPDGYTLMTVTKLKDGYEGGMILPHQPFESARFVEKTKTFEECCKMLEQQFSKHLPDHKCGPGCTDWHPWNKFLEEPSGTIQ